MRGKIRTLVVDDSSVVRQAIKRMLTQDVDIEVVGDAADPFEAREMLETLRPDVITLDLQMPRMDGLTFLEKLMVHFPMPVVVVSSVAQHNSVNAVRALHLGAVAVVPKPQHGQSISEVATELIRAVRVAGMAKVRGAVGTMPRPAKAPPPSPSPTHGFDGNPARLVAIGASTGGVRALHEVVTRLPAKSPPVIAVQHIPAGYSESIAQRLDNNSRLSCSVAQDGQLLAPGSFTLAPGDRHVRIMWTPAGYLTVLDDGPKVNAHRPSVDVLFDSVAEHARHNALGVILTGMGRDGARGLLRMRTAGAHTIAEAESSCVVYGMPRVAIERGAVAEVLDIRDIANAVSGWGIRTLRNKASA